MPGMGSRLDHRGCPPRHRTAGSTFFSVKERLPPPSHCSPTRLRPQPQPQRVGPAMQCCSCTASRSSGAAAPSGPPRLAPKRLALPFDPLRLQRRRRAAAAAAEGSSEPDKPVEPM